MKMKRCLLLCCMIAAAFVFSGCLMDSEPAPTALPPLEGDPSQDLADFHALYDQISFNMTPADCEALLGPGHTEEIALSDGTGLNMSWERNGIYTTIAIQNDAIVGKTVDVGDPRNIAPLCKGFDVSKVHTLTKDMDYVAIAAALGCDGIEVLQSINRATDPITVTFLMRWADENGNTVQILFNADGSINSADNAYYFYAFPTLEPGATYAPTPTADPEATPRFTAQPTGAAS